MAEKRGFDLGALLGSVQANGAAQEAIVLLPLASIDPDPENFYSLDGIDELAGNIELLGLMDPIRVRPNGDRYTIVSGHRRRAAIQLIADGGSEQFAAGVPCIVEYGEATPAMRKLRLIYANASTRRMTSAELSQQAEEVERLLYELKEEGVSFPGRMQEHVAQAVGTTTSKLKRLHAIRANLDPFFLKLYDTGEFVEDAAYHMQQFDPKIQSRVADLVSKGRKLPNSATLAEVLKDLKSGKQLPACKHCDGAPCPQADARLIGNILAPYYWQTCERSKCCLNCLNNVGCRTYCSFKCEDEKDAKRQAQEETAKREEARKLEQEQLRARVRKRCTELLPLIDKAGLKNSETLTGASFNSPKVKDVRRWAVGDFENDYIYSYSIVAPKNGDEAQQMAKRLGCSVLFAMDIKDQSPAQAQEPAGVPVAVWQTGTPTRAGRYFTSILIRDARSGDIVSEHRAEWDGECWWLYQQKLLPGYEVVGWWPLPDMQKEEEDETV